MPVDLLACLSGCAVLALFSSPSQETEFHSAPTQTLEALISINNKLQQPDAARGLLKVAQRFNNLELSWCVSSFAASCKCCLGLLDFLRSMPAECCLFASPT